MKKLRIIPRIDIKNNNLVKGIQLEGLRVMGDPSKFVNHYIKEGADEIFYQDIVASLYGRNSILEIISDTAKVCSIPLIVGGGIRSINDIKSVLNAGADKVAINSAGIKNPSFLREAVEVFGSSTIISCIEIGIIDNDYVLQIYNGREIVPIKLIDWIEEVQKIGVGEINLTCINTEGTGNGFDERLLNLIFDKIDTQITVHGGFGNTNQIIGLFKKYKFDGLVLSSMLHYKYVQNLKLIENEIENSLDGNKEFLKNIKIPNRIECIELSKLKKILFTSGIDLRMSNE